MGFKNQDSPHSPWPLLGPNPPKNLTYTLSVCTLQGREQWASNLTQKPK